MNTQKSNLTPIPILGKSMWPLLDGGEVLLVDIAEKPLVLEKKDIGSLFVFKEGEEWICHRYLGKRDTQYLFKGDYSTGYEAFNTPHVLGRVEGYKKGSYSPVYLKKQHFEKIISFLQMRSLQNNKFAKAWRYTALVVVLLRKKISEFK